MTIKGQLFGLFVLMAAITLPSTAARADADADQAHVVAGALNGYIRPAFVGLAQAGTALQSSVATFCKTPDAVAHAAAATTYRAALEAFARVEFLRFGPLMSEHRLERLVFWPDRKSTGRRQVERIVATHDASVLSLESLRVKSVAVQGLSALEEVLFNDALDVLLKGGEDATFRCAYAGVLAENIAVITSQLSAEWNAADGYG